MMSNKSVSMSREEIDWVNEKAKTQSMSFSGAIGSIIRAHKQMDPEIRKQEALAQLRAAAIILWKDLEIPQEAIISWVRDATGGE